jgi:uncharacterized cupin superfamily protein
VDWKNIINLKTLKLDTGPGVQPYSGKFNRPAGEMGAKKLGFNVRTIPPGEFSCPYHFHQSEEELFLILEGKGTLRQANQFREISEGDLIFLQTGAPGAHQIYNHTSSELRLLAISNRDTNELVEYPDSRKIYDSKTKKLTQSGNEVDYWKDELDPGRFWPNEIVGRR